MIGGEPPQIPLPTAVDRFRPSAAVSISPKFGDTDGIAPGFKGSLGWRKLELYGESEYVVDANNGEDSFFYNWSELTLAPVDWFRFGMVTQRTHVYESDREIQRGVLVGVSFKHANVTGYVFNPDKKYAVCGRGGSPMTGNVM